MYVSHYPFTGFGRAKIERCENRIDRPISKTDTEAAGLTQPAILTFAHECAALNVAPAAVDDVARPYAVFRKTFGILRGDACNPDFGDSVVADVLRHDRRYADWHIISGMKLASERPCLNATGALSAHLPEGLVGPATRQLAKYFLDAHQPTPPKPRPDSRRQVLGLGKLRLKLLLQGGEAFGKGRLVLLRRLGSHIAARGQDVAVGADLIKARRFAEARHVGVALAQPSGVAATEAMLARFFTGRIRHHVTSAHSFDPA